MPITQETIAYRDSTFTSNNVETGATTGENILWKLDRPTSTKRYKPSLEEIRSWNDKTTRSVAHELFLLKYRQRVNLKVAGGSYLLGSINSFAPITYLGGLYPHFDSSDFSTQITTAEKNRLRGKMRKSAVNLAQMLAEYRQTASLFSNLAQDAARLTRAFVRKQPGLLFGNKKVGTVSDHYLKYQFGMRPLVSDMHDSLASLKRRFLEDIYYETSIPIHRQARSPSFTVHTMVYPNTLYLNNIFYDVSMQRDGRLYGRVKMDNSVMWNSMGTFGLTNPFATAWELSPWSFAIDWMFNVGKVLTSLDSCLYCKDFFIYDATTTVSRIDFTYKADSLGYQKHDVDLGSRIHKSYIRTGPVMDQLVQQLDYVPSPSSHKVALATALIGQVLSRR